MIVSAQTMKTEDEGTETFAKGEVKHRSVSDLDNDQLMKEYHWARGSHDSRGKRYVNDKGEGLAFKSPHSPMAKACEEEVIKRGMSTL